MERLELMPRGRVAKDHALIRLFLGLEVQGEEDFETTLVRLVDQIAGRVPLATMGPGQTDRYQIRIVSVEDQRQFGDEAVVTLAVPIVATPPEHGFPLLLAVAMFGSVFAAVKTYQVLDIELPDSYLATLPGPQHGAQGILDRHGGRRVLYGIVLRPRFHSDAAQLERYVRDFTEAGIDYILEDELTTPEPSDAFGDRIELVRAAIDLGNELRDDPARVTYITSITSKNALSSQLARVAIARGADGVMFNPMVMCYDIIQDLAEASDYDGLIVANMIGRGILTGGPSYRFAPDFLCKLTRLVGADAIYIQPFEGDIRNPLSTRPNYEMVLTQDFSDGSNHDQSAAIMSGGMGFVELIKNQEHYRGPLMLSIGERCAVAWERGVPAKVIISSLNRLSSAYESGDQNVLVREIDKLERAGSEHRLCLDIFGARGLL